VSDFEDGLWSKLLDDHGAELMRMHPRPRGRRQRSWRAPLAAASVALTGAAVVVALTVTASTSPPAYALVVNPDGSVTLTINELIGVSGANAELTKLGVRARVARLEPGCVTRGHFVRVRVWNPPRILEPELLEHGKGRFGRLRMVIHPNAIPQGDTLLLSIHAIEQVRPASWLHNRHGHSIEALAMSEGMYQGPAPACEHGLVTLRGLPRTSTRSLGRGRVRRRGTPRSAR
jgi:hypothetical protein